jgi:hypothetical protein
MRDFERSRGDAGAALWTNFAWITVLQTISAERTLLRGAPLFAARCAPCRSDHWRAMKCASASSQNVMRGAERTKEEALQSCAASRYRRSREDKGVSFQRIEKCQKQRARPTLLDSRSAIGEASS